jgi:hypothetical protein
MQHLVDSVRAAAREQNWYAALSVALALPDICAKVEDPSQRDSQKRYVAWFDKFLAATYKRVAGTPHTFLTGPDLYALRCAFLHEGEFDISAQGARAVLDSYAFVATPPGTVVHMNQMNNTLQLQVDIFCEEVCAGVEAWMANVATSSDVQARIAALPQVKFWGPGFSL